MSKGAAPSRMAAGPHGSLACAACVLATLMPVRGYAQAAHAAPAPQPAAAPSPSGPAPEGVAPGVAESAAALRGRQILVTWKGALRSPPSVERTKEAARRRAREVLGRLRAREDFAVLVERFSDEPDAAARGGDLGVLRRGELLEGVERALVALSPGQVADDAVESPFGFHVLQRLEEPAPVVVSHLLVSWKGALRAPHGVVRSREDALRRAMELAAQLEAGGDFAELARANSDDKPSAATGGLVGPLRRGMAVPAFEKAAQELAPGKVSAPIETPFGFHLIRRAP